MSALRVKSVLGAIAFSIGLGLSAAQANGIAFVGDSMSDGIWGAFVRMTARQPCPPDFGLYREAQNGTGLTRPDRLDWSQHVAEIARQREPNLFVISVGLNDRQPIVRADGSRVPLGTQEWVDAYWANTTALLTSAASTGAAVLILGIPVLRDAEANTHAELLNRIFESAASRVPHAQYVAPWQLDGTSGFTSFGAGPRGNVVQLRAPDGIHFTQTGYDLLGIYLRPVILGALGDGADSVTACFGG